MRWELGPCSRDCGGGELCPCPPGQPSRQGSTEQLCQPSAAGNSSFLYPALPTKLPQAVSQRKSFVPKGEGFYHQRTLFIAEFLLVKELVTCSPVTSLISGDSKHGVIPQDLTNYFLDLHKIFIAILIFSCSS